MAETVYIHADANGTYLGNGGFIMLNELGVQLARMGYEVRWFDRDNLLHPTMWEWTGYAVPDIAPFHDMRNDTAPIVTTWLYSWLGVLARCPDLWPRLKYWCSGELLRDESQYDPSRAFVREHVREIAINNPSLAQWYEGLGITPRWHWTNWVRELFTPDPSKREPGLIGYQPDGDDLVGEALRAAFGADHVLACTGTHPEVAAKMQHCDLFMAWNKPWIMICGLGESFGLNAFEAMASGCIAIVKRHCGNQYLLLAGTVVNDVERGIATLAGFLDRMEYDKKYRREWQLRIIRNNYRFDDARREAIRGYLNG